MEPLVTRRETKLHLSYQLPHRIFSSHIYPIAAPNGSTVIIYGHDRGVRVLWRGGRRRTDAVNAPQQTGRRSGTRQGTAAPSNHAGKEMDERAAANGVYALRDDHLDSDEPFSSIVHDIDIDLQTATLSLGILDISPSSDLPRVLRSHAVVVASQANGNVMVLVIPLAPPSTANLHEYVAMVKRSRINLIEDASTASQVALKLALKHDDLSGEPHGGTQDFLVVSALSNTLHSWTVEILEDSLALSPGTQISSVTLPSSGVTPSFRPLSKYNWLLFHDKLGVVRVYDVFSVDASSNRQSPTSSTATPVMTYFAPYHVPKEDPASARRKSILDTKWVLGGRGILALLEDGEWGIWDISGQSHTGANLQEFALNGFLDSMSPEESTEVGKQTKARGKLAPMTPNTRKSKAEDLFSSQPKPHRSVLQGGISVYASRKPTGQIDESVTIWYSGDVFTIPNMQTFWQRSLNNGSGLGSLYAPGLTHLGGINLMQENITSISQFADGHTSSSILGKMNTTRDLLIAAEHRLIIRQTARPPNRSRVIIEPTSTHHAEDMAAQDQQMLDAGALTLGDMDRMLENMADDGRARKVGFVSS